MSLAETKKTPEAALALAQRPAAQEAALQRVDRSSSRATRGARRDWHAPAREAIAAPSGLGAEPRRGLARRAARRAGREPIRGAATPSPTRWRPRLDTRPTARVVAGDLAREVYLDPDLEEKL